MLAEKNIGDVWNSGQVRSSQSSVIEFGGENSRWYYGTYNLPQFVGAYENLNAFLDVECPNIGGGCDEDGCASSLLASPLSRYTKSSWRWR